MQCTTLFDKCPAINVAHAVSVAANPTTSYYVQGTGYAACTYDITCEQGYCRNGLQCVELLDGQICKDDGTGPENCLPTQITDRVTNTCKYCPVGKKPNAKPLENAELPGFFHRYFPGYIREGAIHRTVELLPQQGLCEQNDRNQRGLLAFYGFHI